MKKLHILIPSLVATASIPLIGLVGCKKEKPEKALCFTTAGEQSLIYFDTRDIEPKDSIDIEYKYDNGKWHDWEYKDSSSLGKELTITKGHKLYVRNTKEVLSKGFGMTGNKYFTFIFSSESDYVKASGNVNSMINYANLSDYCFYGLFKGCTKLITAPYLPSETVVTYCYGSMFEGCSNLRVNNRGNPNNKIFTCPTSTITGSVANMFYGTGGEFQGTPIGGDTYYWY